MLVISIVGARPQFVKAATMCRAVRAQPDIEHLLVHTGQHYAPEMSDIFFRELEIPDPDYHLGAGSGSHAVQTAEIMKALEPVLVSKNPDWVLLYGDTNSTLAGATVAAKLGLPTAHIEAGLRSFNRRMPEEINRVVADHLSDLLLCPTETALRNAAREGLAERAILTGDVMFDSARAIMRETADRDFPVPDLKSRAFALATVHRAENTDAESRLLDILAGLEQVSREICPVIFPIHPRTRKRLEALRYDPRSLRLIPPVGYLDMMLLQSRAKMILTDSGGVQKEAYFLERPCVTLRDETEWVETLTNGCNVLTGADTDRIVQAAKDTRRAGPWQPVYGTGDAATKILDALCCFRVAKPEPAFAG
jgi:UDP-GlcNAc3NAcA epimerase